MRINITEMYYAMSHALDAVEGEAVGATTGHGQRVAYLCARMLRQTPVSDAELTDFVGVALLHDCAFGEYLREEFGVMPRYLSSKDVSGAKGRVGNRASDPAADRASDPAADCASDPAADRANDPAAGPVPVKTTSRERALALCDELGVEHEALVRGARHCVIGEKSISNLPFHTDVKNVILWHHENANGSGPLRLTGDQINLKAQLIHLADMLDMIYDLRDVDQPTFDRMTRWVHSRQNILFCEQTVNLYDRGISFDALRAIHDQGPAALLRAEVPTTYDDYTHDEVVGIARFFANIVDYKSAFTKDHSLGVARKAEALARHYGWDEEKVTRFYLAGALHDVGKLLVPTGILEKPDRLTREEFGVMRDHAAATRAVLSRIDGMEDITEWASNHHEKLDGSGYSLGLSADQLSFEDRVMGCVDVYQALTEKRPYKDGLPHVRAVAIMRGMAADGKIDANVVEDIDHVFGDGSVEAPAEATPAPGVRRWKCPVCGYIYEGDEPPQNCPVCGAEGYRFLPV